MRLKNSNFFRNKKIIIMGLGILGRGIGVAKFLAEQGAILTITDLKTKEQLRAALAELKKYKSINYVLGKHRLADFRNKDMVIKAASVPFDSSYIKEAKKNKIPVEMDASLFVKLAPPKIKIVGITGTRGKSTVTHLIYECLKKAGKKTFLGGNVKDIATLPLLNKVGDGNDVMVVMELDSWQLQGFGDSKISPRIAVFTNFMPDHMDYYKNSMKRYFGDKANIFKYQKKGDILIVGEKAREAIRKRFKGKIKSKLIIARAGNIPKNWKIKIPGRHNLENIAAAIAALKVLGVKKRHIKNAVQFYNGPDGRMEFVRSVKGVKYYNDTTATIPDAVIAGLESMKKYKGKIILIGGGADKNLDYKNYAKAVKKYAKALILFKGAASDKIMAAIGQNPKLKLISDVANMKSALKFAAANSKKGDIIILSPGAASFGIFKNEFDRGNQFVISFKRP